MSTWNLAACLEAHYFGSPFVIDSNEFIVPTLRYTNFGDDCDAQYILFKYNTDNDEWIHFKEYSDDEWSFPITGSSTMSFDKKNNLVYEYHMIGVDKIVILNLKTAELRKYYQTNNSLPDNFACSVIINDEFHIIYGLTKPCHYKWDIH